MKETVLIQQKNKLEITFALLKKDLVFTFSLVLAALSCFIQPPKLEYINFHVLVCLFNLMLAIKAFEELKVLDKLAISLLNKSKNSKSFSAILILLCFFSSMIVTNDVALLTFVPLTLVISKKTNIPMMVTVILQTIAANIGSSLTPMGNPQNLFIYSYFGIKQVPFFTSIVFMAILGISSLYFLIRKLKSTELKVDLTPVMIVDGKKATVWGIVFIIIIASIFGILHDQMAFIITLMISLLLNKKILVKIDYLLLLTFICFFIFIGNISHAEAVQALARTSLKNSASVYFSSIFFSQLISNVPASILLSHFTTDWKPLLLGVNIGGLGTIIASLASVISYKLFIQSNPSEGKQYLTKFTIYNFAFLLFFALVQFAILKFLKMM
ncbi:SLC13 family permease [Neobacillus cucumis]|uniref:SLC13 family permease n=1 Tax=Neobacillus cucumis TaxID=1740721 RepID=UPI00203CF7BE|nr:SLC13 family permease [Neobacillus cucumis]MCM3727050.1 SLC13 family permease [Neobacillus cucumis]